MYDLQFILVMQVILFTSCHAVAAFTSVSAGYVEMIAGQFQIKGQKIS